MSDDKKKRIEEALKKIDKRLGKNTVVKGNKEEYEVIPTGLIDFDFLGTGIGGYPKGRIVEQYSKPSCGKTTLFLMAVAECQKAGGICAWVDAEFCFDPVWAEQQGVNVDELYIVKPDTAEDSFSILEDLIDSGGFDFIVIDSVSRLTPRAEIEGGYGDSHMGLQARLLSQMGRKLVAKVSNSNCCLAFINQIRHTMNTGFGAKTTTSGGLALSFYSSIRIELSMIKTLSESGKEPWGNIIRAKFTKNKCAKPFRQVELLNVFGEGFSREQSLVNLALKYDIIQKKGSWISKNGSNICQGENNLIEMLKNDKEFYKKTYDEVINILKNSNDEILEEEKVIEGELKND